MDSLLNRYRNVTVLLLVIFAQLVLLAYQVKSNRDVRLIRVWAVTAVTPVAKVIESVRSNTVGAVRSYFLFHNAAEENRRMKEELGKLKLENQFLRSELDTADRLKALSLYQAHNPSRTVPARVIGTGTGTNAKVVFIDRGSTGGVLRGMAVITPDGIVGKVIAAYPTASQVLLITDPTFAAGVIAQKHRVHGTVRGQGHSTCAIDYIQNEEQVDAGEKFYTSGDDGVFPKGLPVGAVTVARAGTPYKQVFLAPSGLAGGLEEVLVILEGVHQPVPETSLASSQVHVQAPPPDDEQSGVAAGSPKPGVAGTEADRLWLRYKQLGEAQNHQFGFGLPGSRPPDFNLTPEQIEARAKAGAGAKPAPQPGTAGPGQAPATGQPAQPGTGAQGQGPTSAPAAPGTGGTAPPSPAQPKPATPEAKPPATGGTAPNPAQPKPAPGTQPSNGAQRPPAVNAPAKPPATGSPAQAKPVQGTQPAGGAPSQLSTTNPTAKPPATGSPAQAKPAGSPAGAGAPAARPPQTVNPAQPKPGQGTQPAGGAPRQLPTTNPPAKPAQTTNSSPAKPAPPPAQP